jgi:uncharacterized protein (TIGR02757 family)
MLQAKDFLNKQVQIYNQPGFIELDPICIPHLFTKKQDIEIAGLFAAVFAWGQRTTIINKCTDLMNRMDNAPHEFVMHHSSKDLKRLLNFKHRTFNDTDLLYFISFLKFWYNQNESLETAFSNHLKPKDKTIENALNGFRGTFFSLTDVPHRTMKHIASPIQNSACKRLCMYLRWMVRKDSAKVDFGIWPSISAAELCLPLDVHTGNVSRKLGLLKRKQNLMKSHLLSKTTSAL